MIITRNQLAATLRESVFTPSKPGPMQVVLDVGDVNYYIRRALEFVTFASENFTPDSRIMYLENAITLLAVAKFQLKKEKEAKNNIKIDENVKT